MLKMIETFSGIGSQAQALKNLEIDVAENVFPIFITT